MEDPTNPYFINNLAPIITEYEAEFVPDKNIFQNSPVSLHSKQHKKKNRFVSGIFKWTISVKLDVYKYQQIEILVNPRIKDKYNLTPKTSPVY